MTDTERIEALEKKVTELEGKLALLSAKLAMLSTDVRRIGTPHEPLRVIGKPLDDKTHIPTVLG